ncbi:MAG: RNA 3'-terminal-phosphate cyclase [Euryarchaeota archaeon RBG_19FT_COMBO_69_17]|nr:MAG: RNA 3'-terminal-phosphate cyclase [Euryarchaeota archaeon RBG_19FT_COMBO_69_17]
MLLVDGSTGEGGGQILRMAVALAATTLTEVRVEGIRAGRPSPGLAAQHVTAVKAVAALCAAEVEGLEVGSKAITFRPGPIEAGRHAFDVGTAGAVTLVLQACLPVALAAPGPVRIRLVGGTDVRWSPPVDYVSRVLLPLLRRLGGPADLLLLRRGYYPRGGGAIELSTRPADGWAPLAVDAPGVVRSVRGIAHVSNLPEDIPKRVKHAAMRRLRSLGDVQIEERVYKGDEAVGQGGAFVLWAETEASVLGCASLAERGKPSERVGQEAAGALLSELESGASLDVHAADQVLPYLALAPGPSSFTVREATGHLRTMAWLVEKLLGREVRIEPQNRLWRVAVPGPRS